MEPLMLLSTSSLSPLHLATSSSPQQMEPSMLLSTSLLPPLHLATSSPPSQPSTSSLPPLYVVTSSPPPQPPTSTSEIFCEIEMANNIAPSGLEKEQASLNENAIGVDSANRSELSPLDTPYVGMEFASVEEAKKCYDEYEKRHEFCTLQRDIKRTIARSNQITSVTFVCQRQGKQKETSQTYAAEQERYTVASEADARGVKGKRGKARTSSSVRVGCKAALRLRFDGSRGRYWVSAFNDNHNHGFVTRKRDG